MEGLLEPLDEWQGSDTSLLELVDHVLNQGVVLRGDLVLGVAGVDLIYAQLSLLLCAADRLLPYAARRPELEDDDEDEAG